MYFACQLTQFNRLFISSYCVFMPRSVFCLPTYPIQSSFSFPKLSILPANLPDSMVRLFLHVVYFACQLTRFNRLFLSPHGLAMPRSVSCLPNQRIPGAFIFRDDFNTLEYSKWHPLVGIIGYVSGCGAFYWRFCCWIAVLLSCILFVSDWGFLSCILCVFVCVIVNAVILVTFSVGFFLFLLIFVVFHAVGVVAVTVKLF